MGSAVAFDGDSQDEAYVAEVRNVPFGAQLRLEARGVLLWGIRDAIIVIDVNARHYSTCGGLATVVHARILLVLLET